MRDAHRATAVTELHRELTVVACLACTGVAEVTGTFTLPGSAGDEAYLRTRCLDGHVVVAPAFAVAGD